MKWIQVLQKLDIADSLTPLIYAPDYFRETPVSLGRCQNKLNGDKRVWLQKMILLDKMINPYLMCSPVKKVKFTSVVLMRLFV